VVIGEVAPPVRGGDWQMVERTLRNRDIVGL
jgi:hypothetical protein